ncbi:7851_t:CDS:2 [Entrophospora sp. SA101]|nr:7851_t:CDS:2 [Entrophospora sp. SA101]
MNLYGGSGIVYVVVVISLGIDKPFTDSSCSLCYVESGEEVSPEPIFSDDRFSNEWIGKYDDIFSGLYEENNRDFGIERINESIRKYIKLANIKSLHAESVTRFLVYVSRNPELQKRLQAAPSVDFTKENL